MKTLEELKTKTDELMAVCETTLVDRPWAVCVAMHEFFRSLYPVDPYISLRTDISTTERVWSTANEMIDFLNVSKTNIGAYDININPTETFNDVKDKTGSVYGKLWNKFSTEELTEKATAILKERLDKNGFDYSTWNMEKALDQGCGSGRFSVAVKNLGAKEVIGVDYGNPGLELAEGTKDKTNLEGVTFQKANVLDLPFEDETFDFVLSNGVLHHTENMEKGLSEMVRVAKKGAKIWLYLYADGGIFWYARKVMPPIMKKIPQDYTIRMLDLMGMPQDRFIFTDNWYVPIERHSTDKEVRGILSDLGITKIHRLEHGRDTDLEHHSIHGTDEDRIMYGDGELRYILEK